MGINEALKKVGSEPKKRLRILMKDGNMTGYFLDDCLDAIWWGGQSTVLYPTSTLGILEFVLNWKKQNGDNYEKLLLSHEYPKFNIELPFVNHEKCPSYGSRHGGTFRDLYGITRCAHFEELDMKKGFIFEYSTFDENANLNVKKFVDEVPIMDDDFMSEYVENMKMYENSDPVVVKDMCLAIISDKHSIIPLETILDRSNLNEKYLKFYCTSDRRAGPCRRVNKLTEYEKEIYDNNKRCPGHKKINEESVFYFDGWKMASYFKKWLEQESRVEYNQKLPIYNSDEPVII